MPSMLADELKARGWQKMYKTVKLVTVYRIMTGSTASIVHH
jgi:hypothetical protein